MSNSFVLDACALIAFFRKESGWEKIGQRITNATDGSATLIMHNATVAEVYYDSLRYNASKASQLLSSLAGLPVHFTSLLNNDFIKSIGFYKTHYKMSFADCFVCATAEIYDATIVTSDRHEFETGEKDGRLRFEWIR